MNKRIILVHGWGGSPNNDWFPWAKEELEKLNYSVSVPEMPDTDNPQIKPWVETLTRNVGEVDENTVLIGHSIGCQTILRFLETLPEDQKADKVLLVAPWGASLTNLDDEEEWEVAKPWLETPINFEKVRSKAKTFVAIFSDNDPYVPLEENKKVVEEKLGAMVVIEKHMGHFTQTDKVFELPELLKHI